MKKSLLSLLMASSAIAASAANFDITVVTNNGNVQGVVESVSYTFEVTTPVAVNAGAETPILLVDGEESLGAANVLAYGAETSYVRFMEPQQSLFKTPGHYVLNIPEGAFKDEAGNVNNATTYTWIIENNGFVPAPFDIENVTMAWAGSEIEAGSEVNALSYSFTVTAANSIHGAGEGHIEMLNAEGNPVGTAQLLAFDSNTAYLRFYEFGETGLTVAGTYTLNIPAGSLVDVAGNPCNAFTATWTVKEQVELGEAVFNIEQDPFYGYAMWSDLEPQGLSISWPNAQNVTPDMTVRVSAVLKTTLPDFGQGGDEDDIDPGFGVPELVECTDVTTFYGDALFGDLSVNFTDFLQYIYEAGNPSMYAIVVKEITVSEGDNTVYSWTASDEEPELGTLFYVDFEQPVDLGYPVFNIDEDPFYDYAMWSDLEPQGLTMTWPEAQNVTPEMTVTVNAVLMTELPGYGHGDEDDVDPGFGMPELVECTDVTTFTGDALFGELTVNFTDFLQYIYEAGNPSMYAIIVSSITVNDGERVVYSWEASDEEPVCGTLFYVDFEQPEDPTSISNIAAEKNAVMYNLQGQRVNAAKGMVIVNGKKAFVK